MFNEEIKKVEEKGGGEGKEDKEKEERKKFGMKDRQIETLTKCKIK
jgi:hypothetical protein